MNVIKNLIERIEKRRIETAKPCKAYATEEKAEAVASEYALRYGKLFDRLGNPCRYVVVYNVAWGKWVIGFDFTELMGRRYAMGGYVGVAADEGFYTY